ncbi:phenylacetate--CoA ligase family protein [Azohydromonas sp.]|uniref:phenylacetate--CoA ligase family protein n=1 Tax=Azohydromonas sp. TaxID=1872666 RepID=UPI002C44EE9B|nr:phenylacetate--CoA ligase family protein [Azohydromonas sp.]HMM84554.1 phenylacetate--CoA ligase family protein [Azohydromonas sp.]
MGAATAERSAPAFDALRSARAMGEVLRDGTASAAELAQRQAQRLRALLDAARRGSRLYAQLHRGADAHTPLAALPAVTKPALMQRFDDWVTDPALRLDTLRAFVADPDRAADAWLGRYTVWESSGSSGEPGLFVEDPQAMAVYDALEWLRRARAPAGGWFDPLRLARRQALVVATGGHFASHVSLQRLRRLNPWLGATLRSFSILQPLDALLAELQAWQPAVLATYPTAASMLGDAVDAGALRLTLAELDTGGETLGAALRARLTRQFGCAVRDHYGASEFLSIGWECAHGRMHMNTDWVILEPVDARGRPVPPGQLSHTTLLTNLANHVQPLIRYDLGDRLRWHDAPCPCGSALPAAEVVGRCDDALRMRGDDGRRVTLLPLALTTVLEDNAGVFDFQLRQRDARTLVLRLGGDAARSAAARERCHRALRAYAAALGLRRLAIVDETGHAPAHGRSGKVQRVIAAR